MSNITMTEAVRELNLKADNFEKYHKMTLGIASFFKFTPASKTLKKLNQDQYILPVIILVGAGLLMFLTSGFLVPVIILGINYLVGKRLAKRLEEYCNTNNINIDINHSTIDLLDIRNKMIAIANAEKH